MNLYEINDAIMACIDEESGEILNSKMLDDLIMTRDEKLENIGLWIKNLSAEAEAIKQEKMNLAHRQKVCENKAESLKNYLSGFLNGAKFSTPRVAISFRKSKAVEIGDEESVVKQLQEKGFDKCLKIVAPTVNKTELKKALESGLEIENVMIVENQNIQIK